MRGRGGDAITTIPLRKATRDRLKQMGSKAETYDEILNRLMDFHLARAPHAPGPVAGDAPQGPPALVDFEPLGEVDEPDSDDDPGSPPGRPGAGPDRRHRDLGPSSSPG